MMRKTNKRIHITIIATVAPLMMRQIEILTYGVLKSAQYFWIWYPISEAKNCLGSMIINLINYVFIAETD